MNKILGIASVVIMIGAMGYLVVNEFSSSAEVDAVRATGTKQSETTAKTDSSESSTTESTKEKESDLPDVSPDDWQLVLVGPDHKLEKEIDESTQLVSLDNGYLIDKRVEADYKAFANAASEAGFPLAMVSAYRSVSSQQEVFTQHVQEVMAQKGVTEEEATTETKLTMTEPGYSEHHTGLAVDVVDQDWYNNYTSTVLDASYGDQPGAKWIAENAPKYGFIVRYPNGREDITKITYEPWHLRYVGKESAKYITEHDLTLEEYLDKLKK